MRMQSAMRMHRSAASDLRAQTCLGKPVYDNETQMLAWLVHGPLSVSIDAGALGGYRGGLITDCNRTRVDHVRALPANIAPVHDPPRLRP